VARLVLTDASPLIGLSSVQGLGWLQTLFGEVWMPPEVEQEVLAGPVTRGQEAIRAAIAAGSLRTWSGDVPEVALPDLDEGESACIRIALAHQATSGNEALLLMDERAGRAVAQEHQLRLAGTAAVIGLAQTRGLIPSARNVFEGLLQSDFRISAEVIRTVLARIDTSRV
jgi:predicted nucleic acid-binding protein